MKAAPQISSSVSIKPPGAQAASAPTGEDEFAGWVKSRLEASNPSFVSIVDRKPWPQALTPNTSIVLGIAQRSREGAHVETPAYSYFPFVFLFQSQADNPSAALKKLGLAFQEGWYIDPPGINGDNHLLSIDVTPIQILKDEYAFGVRTRAGSLGNKSGLLLEVISLFRYRFGIFQEIFRDVVWAYSKYSEKDFQSCNVDMELESRPSTDQGFFTITRKYRRSYLGEAGAAGIDAPCALSNALQTPNVHRWSPEKGKYLDSRGRFLQYDDIFKGWPN